MCGTNVQCYQVDNNKNCYYNPIGREDVWVTKWWPMWQFMFICSVAEVNAVNLQAHLIKGNTNP